jgi:hypothetical protein
MATIINNPRSSEPTIVEPSSGSSFGWAIAVIILLAVIIAGVYAWVHYKRPVVVPNNNQPGANINITLPEGNNSGNNSSGGTQTNPQPNPAQ